MDRVISRVVTQKLFTSWRASYCPLTSKFLVKCKFEDQWEEGVFFRKHTRETAKKLGLVGWVRNTPTNTVKGNVQGPEDKIAQMKTWLKTKGSPKSSISKCDFKNEAVLKSVSLESFEIKK